jgi:hypothetical protein
VWFKRRRQPFNGSIFRSQRSCAFQKRMRVLRVFAAAKRMTDPDFKNPTSRHDTGPTSTIQDFSADFGTTKTLRMPWSTTS